MISIVGLGTAGTRIAKLFEEQPQYNVFYLNSDVERTTKSKFKLKRFKDPEEYEKNIPDLTRFFGNLNNQVQFFVAGSSELSNYTLGVLEQIKDKQVDLFYIKPDMALLAGMPKLVENVAFGVLQQYARSGLLNSITLISNFALEEFIQDVPIKEYYLTLNKTIYSTVHYINYFEHNEPEIGVMATPSEICRIKSIGILNPINLVEKWFFDLDIDREVCYYLCINEERLQTDGGLHKRYVDLLKQKPRNAFRNISYAIYETASEKDFGFCVARTNVVQENA